MTTMATTSLTTRIDSDLKSRLQRVARLERRSASYIANQAIQNLVEEREATRELVETGRMLADKGVSISPEAIHAWMHGPADAPFPEPDTFE
jgi:predicted transcriptional regulator